MRIDCEVQKKPTGRIIGPNFLRCSIIFRCFCRISSIPNVNFWYGFPCSPEKKLKASNELKQSQKLIPRFGYKSPVSATGWKRKRGRGNKHLNLPVELPVKTNQRNPTLHSLQFRHRIWLISFPQRQYMTVHKLSVVDCQLKTTQ